MARRLDWEKANRRERAIRRGASCIYSFRRESTGVLSMPLTQQRLRKAGRSADSVQQLQLVSSMHATIEDPWSRYQSTHRVGEIVEGTVTGLMPYGAFVEISPGVQGLIHISELDHGFVKDPADIVRVGERLRVKVMSIDVDHRRISLSLKQAQDDLSE